ncbi:MAG: hypothetical protein PHC90_07270 [Syntrophorhabdaceae bacterium]|nr:hypothetical protein [Syntrophorhabdaceae bacterium]
MSIIIDVSEDERITVDTFQRGDAKGVGELFRSVYGEDYPVKLVYDPEGLVEAFEKHENIPCIARSSKGRIVGYVSIFRSAPVKTVYEGGQGLVLVDYRKHGIARTMNRYFSEELAPAYDADAVFGEAVCNQVYMQKAWANEGAIETALEVDLMPAEAYVKEGSASGRVAALHMTRMYRPMEHAVYAPERYEGALRFLYDGFTTGGRVHSAGNERPGPDPTFIEHRVFEFARVARMTVRKAGEDFEAVFDGHEADALKQGMIVIQVWLNLSWPFIGPLTEHLRQRGYFFGGMLPRWFGEDGLLMQKVTVRPNWEGIELYSERARRILGVVREDWQRTGA